MPRPAPPLRGVGRGVDALDIPAFGDGHQYRLILDQVFLAQFFVRFGRDAGAAVVAVLFCPFVYITLNRGQDAPLVGQHILQVGDALHQLAVFFFDLLPFQRGQPAQLHVQNGLRLQLAELEARH